MLIKIDNIIIKIRNSLWDDYNYCHHLARRNFQPFYERHKLDWNSKGYRRHFNPTFIKVIECNKRRIGFYELRIKDGSWYLEDLHLSTLFRGKGIGTKIMNLLEKSVKKRGGNAIRLSVFVDNPAINLYKRLGYYIIGSEGAFHFMEKKI